MYSCNYNPLLTVKEELRIYCQQMERQNNKRRKYMINRLWYDKLSSSLQDTMRNHWTMKDQPSTHISPQADMGVSGSYGVSYEKCHIIISRNKNKCQHIQSMFICIFFFNITSNTRVVYIQSLHHVLLFSWDMYNEGIHQPEKLIYSK